MNHLDNLHWWLLGAIILGMLGCEFGGPARTPSHTTARDGAEHPLRGVPIATARRRAPSERRLKAASRRSRHRLRAARRPPRSAACAMSLMAGAQRR
jgi:hypothetical protein